MIIYDDGSSFIHTGEPRDLTRTQTGTVPRVDEKSFTVKLDKKTYAIGDIITISGNVTEVASIGGSIFVLDPKKRVYEKFEFFPNADHSFFIQFELEADSITALGQWTLRIVYLSDIVETSFTVLEKTVNEKQPVIKTSQPRVLDENEHTLYTLGLNSVVGIESEVRNVSINEITFAFIVQIKNEAGYTVSIMWVENWAIPPSGSLKPKLFWFSHTAGNYQAEIFVWESLIDPIPLTSVYRIGFTVLEEFEEGTEEISVRVLQSADDAEENISTGELSLGSSDLELVEDGSEQQLVGLRFQNVQIPKDATIVNARIYFTVDEEDSGQTDLTFYAEYAADASEFTGNDKDISSRDVTRSSVNWDDVPAWNVGEIVATPDLSPIIQEVIDRPGWLKGNSIAIIVTGFGERTIESYDGNPNDAPLLVVNYRMEE
jgi:hypothetical protein